MARVLTDEELETLHLRVVAEYRPLLKRTSMKGQPIFITVDARDIAAALAELKARRGAGRRPNYKRVGPITEALMAMKVGDVVELQPIVKNTLHTFIRTVRKKLDNADIMFSTETLPSGKVRVTRLADGAAPIYGFSRSPTVATMAGMRVGQTLKMTKADLPSGMTTSFRQQARKMMGLPSAKWRADLKANGIYHVKRTA